MKYNYFIMKGGSVYKLPRQHFLVEKWSGTPTVFLEYPSYWNPKTQEMRKAPVERKATAERKISKLVVSFVNRYKYLFLLFIILTV